MMAKGIIVVDVPEKCKYCPFSANLIGAEYYCYIVESIGNYDALSHPISMDEYYSKPDWCPIKELPIKLEEINCPHSMSDYQRKGFSRGFNACLDKLEGR